MHKSSGQPLTSERHINSHSTLDWRVHSNGTKITLLLFFYLQLLQQSVLTTVETTFPLQDTRDTACCDRCNAIYIVMKMKWFMSQYFNFSFCHSSIHRSTLHQHLHCKIFIPLLFSKGHAVRQHILFTVIPISSPPIGICITKTPPWD